MSKARVIKIRKPWESLAGQSITDDKGNKWKASDLIVRSGGLEVMDIPLIHMSCDYHIGGMPLREFVGHMRMVLETEMDCPIILDEDGTIFDGCHRMARAILEERTHIKAKRFDDDPPPTVAAPEESDT